MYTGFFSDERRDKPNILPIVPTVIGMQFLTSAFLLPYLATRSTEQKKGVKLNELSTFAGLSESSLVGITLGIFGCFSIFWFFFGRLDEFGPLTERWTSFMELLSIDRVGASFLVDLAIFSAFQPWLVDDDLKRRSGGVAKKWVILLAKYFPFFGMAAYLIFRPTFDVDPPGRERV